VTFLFTDIEGSTRLWEENPGPMTKALSSHDEALRTAIEGQRGLIYDNTGDGVVAVFGSARDAVAAALAAQLALTTLAWPTEIGALRVRMGLLTDEGILREGKYLNQPLNRSARLMAAAHGGEVVMSSATATLAEGHLPERATLVDLGQQRMRDLAQPLHVYQLVHPDLQEVFPPLRSASGRGVRPLPMSATSLVGRERDIDEVGGLVERPEVRLVTLTGPGGIGKTRLALAVSERLRDRFSAGTVFVPLAEVTRPELVVADIGRAVGADLAGTASPLEALIEQFDEAAWLLILDNLEQVLEVAGDIGELLARCPGVAILATSRTVLGLRAEREYQVPPLPLPADPASAPVDELASSPAVALFVDRARAVRHDFALTEDNAEAVVEICRRLEGLPLAIELAAARTRLLGPGELLGRLATTLDALGAGTVDMPERQHTLRATVEWSVDLLDDAERALLEVTAVFVDGWTIEAAARVAGLDEDRALDLTEALARHSLVQVDTDSYGSRCRMLETVRQFVAERLAARPDAAEVEHRHAHLYRALAEQADRPLRGVGQNDWLDRLDSEAGNLAAAVGWYISNDLQPLAHLFRILWPFWSLRNHLVEARPWVLQLLPAAETLEPDARAELAWSAVGYATDMGDDPVAQAARQRLEPLLEGMDDPFLHAASELVMAWSSPIAGDFDTALGEASASLAEFRAQDEPFWTSLAAFTVGSIEATVGRYDDARVHLRNARDMADGFASAWLTAGSRVQLGTLDLLQGRPAEAQMMLDEALNLSLAANSTPILTLSLVAHARLAFAEGDSERAALLEGAAVGLRRRVGIQAWPMLRRPESELVALVRQALGVDRFDLMFATGSRLSQSEAVSAVRDRRPNA
jgi:predicted ATPase/class 3 adenylate cyclase